MNYNLMIYGAENEWVYRTRFLVSLARPLTQESCLREICRLKGRGGAHFQLCSSNHRPLRPAVSSVSAPCLSFM